MTDAPLLARALARAVTAHEGQTRKRSRTPYAVHPLRVVGRVHAWGVQDPEVLAAAALHDVLEDTAVTADELHAAFGKRVTTLVKALTHPPKLPPRKRTAHILRNLRDAPLEAVVVKLADRLDNSEEMWGWRASSRIGYLGEAMDIARLAEERLAAGDGSEAARAALERALAAYKPAIDARRREAEEDAQRETGARSPRKRGA